nr:MAG TPA: hypothetical protein [Caudoviricetes sp.]
MYLAKRELWLPQKIYFIINFAEGAQDWASFVLLQNRRKERWWCGRI